LEHLLIGEGKVQLVAKIEVVIYYVFGHLLKDFIILGLVNGVVQQLVFKRNKIYAFNAKYFLHIQSRSCLGGIHHAQIRLLVYNQHSHHEKQVFSHLFIHAHYFFFEPVGSEH
jgi:hypothetical protein